MVLDLETNDFFNQNLHCSKIKVGMYRKNQNFENLKNWVHVESVFVDGSMLKKPIRAPVFRISALQSLREDELDFHEITR